mgnify:CR=1 FL=1|jgi:hypothetical protein
MVSLSKRTRLGWILFLLVVTEMPARAQNYYGIQGSWYAGSLGIGNNPASMVNTPFRWDVDILSFQTKYATNGVQIKNYSLLSSPQESQYVLSAGDYRRFAYTDFNINVLNARFALNRRQAIALGMNLRGYAHLITAPYNFIDTLNSTRDFFNLGNFNRRVQGELNNSSWVELFASYGQTIWDHPAYRLNAGITLKASRGISGAYFDLQNGHVARTRHGANDVLYTMRDVNAEYGYSANYDEWKKEKSNRQNIRDFVRDTRGGFSFDLGVEFLIKPQIIPTAFDEDMYYDYDWKIGLSILDIGFNQYKYGLQSRQLSGFYDNITDSLIDERFLNVGSLAEFNDSLQGVVRNIQTPSGLFRVGNPARLVLNVDRFLFNAFYVNANLSVNLSSLSNNPWHVNELNLLTITPRWETRFWGAYLPVQFNRRNQFWVGGALKAGPLLIGIHNWANLFSKNKMANGGGYIALVLRAGRLTPKKLDKQLECPR